MSDIVVKSKYYHGRLSRSRRKHKSREKSRLGQKLKIQIFVSLLIFITIWVISNIDNRTAKYIVEKVRWTLTWNIDIKSIYKEIYSICVENTQ